VVEQEELLQVIEGGGTEPGIHGRRGGIMVARVAKRHGEAAAGARVRREDAGDLAGTESGAQWVVVVVVVEVEVERSGAP